jgi:transposase
MLGIDVSKATLAVCHWANGEVQASYEVENSPAGISQLLAQTPPTEPWALEPTGRYSELVVREAHRQGRQVFLAPPRAAKRFLRSVSPRAKTDRLDAKGLAQYAASVPLKPFVLKEPAMEKLSQLLAARRLLSASRASLRQQLRALPELRAHLEPAIQALTVQLRGVDQELAQLAQREPAILRLQAVPGFGPVAAAALVVRLQSIPFAGYDQFVAYVGLDLRVSESGQRRGRRTLSQQGEAELRRLLYLCAQASIRTKGSPFARQYERELAKGLAKPQALCAVARKLAKVAWAMVRTGADYDSARVYSRPTRP